MPNVKFFHPPTVANGKVYLATFEVMARAGCNALFIGFESVDPVRNGGKKQNKPSKYREIVTTARRSRNRRVREVVRAKGLSSTAAFETTA